MSMSKKLLVSGLSLFALTACGTKEDVSESEAWGKSSQITTVKGRISWCHDGDTCTATIDGTGQRLQLRLAGLDAPEVSGGSDGKGQPLGQKSRDFTFSKVKGKPVEIKLIEKDPYGRTVAEIFVGGQNVNMMNVEAGLAEAYKWATWKINKAAYRAAEGEAKKKKAGVWGLPDYQSPGDFRHGKE